MVRKLNLMRIIICYPNRGMECHGKKAATFKKFTLSVAAFAVPYDITP